MLKDSLIVLASYQEVGKFSLWSLLWIKAEKYVCVCMCVWDWTCTDACVANPCVSASFKYVKKHKGLFRCFFSQHAINLRIHGMTFYTVEKKWSTYQFSSLFENSYVSFVRRFRVPNLHNKKFLWPVAYWLFVAYRPFEICWDTKIT